MPGERILIVEDEPSLRLALADALAGLGYEIIEAGTGVEAYTLAAQQLPDLILLDLGLPDVDGLALAKTLREQPETAGIIVAALTAEEISGPRAQEVFRHCIGYIPRPVGLDRLAHNVALFLRVGRPQPATGTPMSPRDDHPKRRHPRFNVEIGVICRLRRGGRQAGAGRITGLVRNLSEGGVMLELPQRCEKGAWLEIGLRTGDARLHAVGEVVWTAASEAMRGAGQAYRHGLRFVWMDQDQRNAIRRFIVKRFSA